MNSPATVLRLENSETLYLLTNDGLWLQAPNWTGPWTATSAPPGFDRIPADHPVALAVKNAWPAAGATVSVPEVVMSETPTELIQFDGKPKYDRVGELPLVRVSNTRSPLFYHSDQDAFYVLISGRWFVASELTGSWTYVPHNELPAEFTQIPIEQTAGPVSREQALKHCPIELPLGAHNIQYASLAGGLQVCEQYVCFEAQLSECYALAKSIFDKWTKHGELSPIPQFQPVSHPHSVNSSRLRTEWFDNVRIDQGVVAGKGTGNEPRIWIDEELCIFITFSLIVDLLWRLGIDALLRGAVGRSVWPRCKGLRVKCCYSANSSATLRIWLICI